MGVFEHWPNRITALRFVGALVLFAIFTAYGDRAPETARAAITAAFFLFVALALTDLLDGYLARRGNQVSDFGRLADPFVDKVLILGTMIFLAVMHWSQRWFPAWLVVLIMAREFLVTGIRGWVERIGREFPADRFGKLKMAAQCSAISVVLFLHSFPWGAGWRGVWDKTGHVLVYTTLVATLGSGLSYVLKTRQILAGESR